MDPPHLLEFRWGTDTIGFELVSAGKGCIFVLTDVLDDLGKAARDAAGWHTCLDFLVVALDHVTPAFTSSERWKAVHGDYVVQFGPAAATIGPPDSSPSTFSPTTGTNHRRLAASPVPDHPFRVQTGGSASVGSWQ